MSKRRHCYKPGPSQKQMTNSVKNYFIVNSRAHKTNQEYDTTCKSLIKIATNEPCGQPCGQPCGIKQPKKL